jgi:hypothetical protein
MIRESDVVIPLAHLGELRLYRDRKRPQKIWLIFRWPSAGSASGYHYVSSVLADDEIDDFIATIDDSVKTRQPRSYKTAVDCLLEFHPDIHPEDEKREGRVPGRLWIGFHNLRRLGHETRKSRRACLIPNEIACLINALRSI